MDRPMDRPMDRARLAALLPGEEAVGVLARAALSSGAGFEVPPGGVPAARLLSIYRRRERHTRRTGRPTVGFATAVERLAAYPGPELVLGSIDGTGCGGHWFQLFLTPDLDRLDACLAVRRDG